MSDPREERMRDWVYQAAGMATSYSPGGSYQPLLSKVKEIYDAGRAAQREEDALIGDKFENVYGENCGDLIRRS